METASITLNSNDDEQELFVTDEKYNTLDQCILMTHRCSQTNYLV
jgi:hypothetical protein